MSANDRSARLLSLAVFAVFAAALVGRPASAQQSGRFLYAALPGLTGPDKLSHGGSGVVVFDIDHGHKFVKRIPLAWKGPLEIVRGVAAHAGTARLYVSTSRGVTAYDLLTDSPVWKHSYGATGMDRAALSPDGTTLYAPEAGAPKWDVVEAATGDLVASIAKPGTAHNTQYSDDGAHVYLEAQGNTRTISVVDAKVRSIVREIGPFSDVARPFTFNGEQTLLFANVNGLLGFEVADLKTGKVRWRVAVPGVVPRRSRSHIIPSHGIAMTPDETEIWLADNVNHYVRIFDATAMPPTLKASVKVRDEPGWITFGIDGRLAYPSTGDVIDARTKRIVATLQDEHGHDVESEKMLEIDFAGGKPVLAGDQFGKGKKS